MEDMEVQRNDGDRHSIDELFQRSLRFRNTAEYFSFFRFIGKILHYSHYNALLVHMQNKDVRYFGTPNYWEKEFGRKVRPDARPYVIIVPFGPAAMAYDVNETEGDISPEEFIRRGMGGVLFNVHGEMMEELLYEIERNLEEYNIIVHHKHFRINEGGETYIEGRGKIFIDLSDQLSPSQEFSVLIHELAHSFLGHHGDNVLIKETVISKGKNKGKTQQKKVVIEGRKVDRDIMEIEAETVAYLVCCRWNLESSPDRYLSLYFTDKNINRVSVETIIRVADEIESLFLAKFR